MKYGISSIRTLVMFLCLSSLAYGHEVIVNTQDGEAFVFDVDPTESLNSLQGKIAALSYNGECANLLIEWPKDRAKGFGLTLAAQAQGAALGYPRDYGLDLSPEEKGDIRFIVTTLANKNLISIAIVKSDLESAGNRIDHVHPLRFLMTIFSDEEMKVGVRNIRGKGWIWNHFIGGVKESLTAEAGIQNLKESDIRHFAHVVNINPNLIIAPIVQNRWDDFVDALITHIPRVGETNRYDM